MSKQTKEGKAGWYEMVVKEMSNISGITKYHNITGLCYWITPPMTWSMSNEEAVEAWAKAVVDGQETKPANNPNPIGHPNTSMQRDICLCQGKGYWAFGGDKGICYWHNEEEWKRFEYPDGWETNDLIEWCMWQNLPLPFWLLSQDLSIQFTPKFFYKNIIFTA